MDIPNVDKIGSSSQFEYIPSIPGELTKLQDQKNKWIDDLKRDSKRVLEYNKKLNLEYAQNINAGKGRTVDVNEDDLVNVYYRIRASAFWSGVIRVENPGLIRPENRKELIRSYYRTRKSERQGNIMIVHEMMRVYGILQDEITYFNKNEQVLPQEYIKYAKSRAKDIFRIMLDIDSNAYVPKEKGKKNELQEVVEKNFKDLVELLRNIRKTVYGLLESVSDFHVEFVQTKVLWPVDLTDIIQYISRRRTIAVKSWKITSAAGLINDDGMPHDANDQRASGLVLIDSVRMAKQLTFMEQAISTEMASDKFEKDFKRLVLSPGQSYNNTIYHIQLVKTLYKMIQNKYISAYTCIQNLLKRCAADWFGKDSIKPSLSGEFMEEYEEKIKRACSDRISMCWDTLAECHPFVADRAIHLKAINDASIAPNEEFLFGYSTFEKYRRKTFDSQIFAEEEYLQVHRRMLTTYICNTAYLITHSSFRKDKTCPQVTFYIKEKNKKTGQVLLRPALTLHTSSARIYKYLREKLSLQVAKYDSFASLGVTDPMTGDTILSLKSVKNNEGERMATYTQMKMAGTNEMVSTLQMCVEFVLDMLKNDTIQDVYVGTTLCFKETGLEIQPHLPFKYLGLPGGTKYYFEAKDPTEMVTVVGVVDTSYHAPSFFASNYEFQTGKTRLYMYPVNGLLSKYVDANAVECVTNYWFTKKIFEKFEDLRLGYNMETLHFRGTTEAHPYIADTENMHSVIKQEPFDFQVSLALELAKPRMGSSDAFTLLSAGKRDPKKKTEVSTKGRRDI